LAIAEEMLCGLPVLATQVRGHRELVRQGKTGFLFEPDNMTDFVKFSVELYINPVKRIEMGKAACLHAQNYRIEHSLNRMAEIYSEILQIKIRCIY